jgi:phosphoribosylanthranilate isomerase
MLVKLCGFTDQLSVQTAITQKCDFLGFVFYDKSPRFINLKNAAKISQQVPKTIGKVAVVVDSELEFLQEIFQQFLPDFFQFHGLETPDFLARVRKKFPAVKIIKAFKVEKTADLLPVKDFQDQADFFLFDSKIAGQFGGSGQKFDWQILKNFDCKKDWFLSGGLNIKNVAEAIKITGAPMIDVSSSLEKVPGQKSPELITKFMAKIKS